MHKIEMSPTVMDRVKASRGRTHMFDRLDPARTAHIIVDLQNGFMEPGAAIEIPQAREIVPNVNRISAAMALGTLMGGWRIVHTLGSRITRLHPVQGFCAEAGGAATLFLATFLGIPVSTTHTITGAVVGVGAAGKVGAVRWNIASNVVTAWILTMPAQHS